MLRSSYDDVFQYSVSRGHIDCAKLILPFVNLSNISICSLVDRMMNQIEIACRRKKNNNSMTQSSSSRSLDNVLSDCLDTCMFLDDVGYTFESAEDIVPLFTMNNQEYEMYGKHKYYLKIIEYVTKMCLDDTMHRLLTDECIFGGHIGGACLLDELNLFEMDDFDGENFSFSGDFIDILEILQKKQVLADNIMTKLFSQLLIQCFNGSGQECVVKIQKFINFVNKYEYCVVTDNDIFKKILYMWNLFPQSKDQLFESTLEPPIRINVDMEFEVSRKSVYDILISHGISARLCQSSPNQNVDETEINS